MAEVQLKQLKVDGLMVNIRRVNDETVRRYAESLDALPPVTVVKTKDGELILADGFHRVAAAGLLKRETIRADITAGTLRDAQIIAVLDNAKHGRALSTEELHQGIVRLLELGWTNRRVSRELGVSEASVAEHSRTEKVRQTLAGEHDLPHRVLRELAKAPHKNWKALAEVAEKQRWSGEETALAVRTLKDGRATQKQKDDILSGKGKVLVGIDEDSGEPVVRVETFNRLSKEAKQQNAGLAYSRAINAFNGLRDFKPQDVAEQFDPSDFKYIDENAEAIIDYFKELVAAAKAARKPRAVA